MSRAGRAGAGFSQRRCERRRAFIHLALNLRALLQQAGSSLYTWARSRARPSCLILKTIHYARIWLLAVQVGALPGAIPALLNLVSGREAFALGDARPAMPAEVAAAAAQCLAQLSVHERLRPRLVAAGALPALCAAALQAGGIELLDGALEDPGRDAGTSEGLASRSAAAPQAAAAGGRDRAGGGGGDGSSGGGGGVSQALRPHARGQDAAARALQRAAVATVANLCGDAAPAERSADDLGVGALAALAASSDRDVQVGRVNDINIDVASDRTS